ncbi:MAG: aldo/keto reductase [Candidatus Poribacteria bacterium]|nr:aldo/keto reductase [Candidatus Poribacteria bacterium]
MTATISGYATPQATQAFTNRLRARHPAFDAKAYRPLTGTDLITSKIGYGAYRVDHQSEAHVETVKSAIEAGCNLIDTSSNYTDGGSETLIGNVLRDLVADGKIEREEIIVVSKVGYMQGQNLDEAMRREQADQPWEEVVKYMDGCWHCLHPDFLVDQWERSAGRLGLETIDVYLLHNPEYFLSDAKKRTPAANLDAIREAFYDRVYRAFVQMERFVTDGKIRYYGISSNTFPSSKNDFEHVSLNRVYDAACQASARVHGDASASHFQVIQLPYNLLEHGALTEANNEFDGKSVTALQWAKCLGIGVLVNRPLNAFKNNQMTRLAQYPYDPNLDYPAAISEEEQALTQIEGTLESTLTSWGIFDSVRDEVNVDLFYDVAEQLGGFIPRVQSRDHWEQILQQHLIPQVNAYLRQTGNACPDQYQAEWERWFHQYVQALDTLFEIVTGIFNRVDAEKVAPIQHALDEHLVDDEKSLSLSQKALNFVTSSPGVSVVLNGMKREEYVKDAMGIMEVRDFAQPMVLSDRVEREM